MKKKMEQKNVKAWLVIDSKTKLITAYDARSPILLTDVRNKIIPCRIQYFI